MERVHCFRFLGMMISDDLAWTHNTEAILKKAQQRLYFLRCLRRWGMSTQTLVNFYRSIVESVLTGGIAVWYGGATAQDRRALQRVVRTAQRIIGVELPAINDLYITRSHLYHL